MSARGASTTISGAALPLYVSTLAAAAVSLVDTALLGRHATVSLAAFGVTVAVFSPATATATATVAGALRGVMPFVAPYRDDPEELLPLARGGMWPAFAVGGVCAVAVAAVPLLGGSSGSSAPGRAWLVSTAVWFRILAAVSVRSPTRPDCPGCGPPWPWPTCSGPSPGRSPSGGTPAASPRPSCRRAAVPPCRRAAVPPGERVRADGQESAR
ncbi:hypothetical protein [Streptomyces sp. GbtcB6]|uniref:hypothetical protein n=1 Tax=Streptomyces sp. GbtcB6 TaxID=2824751 RepID=UPI0020C5E03A|nr:hypothetical protein [Streptomyces sp. GbtcB6]